ncbi:MAG TPA: flagellar hook-associated protein FlgK [Blastococcus sp.]|nr:flagellar hook-associated protein FlgK [Blastococcus sp.]
MSTFSGLNTATTALWAQRRALDVTGQNIANVNTEGYSRQRIDLQAIGGSVVPAFFSTGTGIGSGVNADEVLRIRDAFLEGRGHTEHANTARLTVENEAYELVMQAYREPGDTGVQSLLSDMWSGWEDVANQPQDEAARGQVLKRLETLVGGIHFSQASLGAQWTQSREALDVLVADVNAAATSVAELNQAIKRAVQSGLPANDLSDKRDVLVMKLADQVGATVRHQDDGVVDVLVGGMTLVAGSTAATFATAGTYSVDGVAGDPPRIVTAAGGYTVRAGGTAEGQLNSLNTIIPSYRNALDATAVSLATSLNTAHAAGWDLNGTPGTAILGSSSGPITAASLTVLISDPKLIAASSVAPTAGVPALDHGNADAIAQLRRSTTGVDANYRKMIVELGVEAAVAGRNLDIQTVISTQVDAARESVAGVNIDEEMTNMLSFQHAYSAAGRLITAIDETLDKLINGTGRVGL